MFLKKKNTTIKKNSKGVKAGWRTIGDVTAYFRSGWEANIARYLELLKKGKQILKWEHEPETFWFNEIKRGTRSYLPDFRVMDLKGNMYYVEVKGWMDAKSGTKLKRMAKYYPDKTIDLIDAKRYKAIEKSVIGLIKDWE